jgi:hypothetical protein
MKINKLASRNLQLLSHRITTTLTKDHHCTQLTSSQHISNQGCRGNIYPYARELRHEGKQGVKR